MTAFKLSDYHVPVFHRRAMLFFALDILIASLIKIEIIIIIHGWKINNHLYSSSSSPCYNARSVIVHVWSASFSNDNKSEPKTTAAIDDSHKQRREKSCDSSTEKKANGFSSTNWKWMIFDQWTSHVNSLHSLCTVIDKWLCDLPPPPIAMHSCICGAQHHSVIFFDAFSLLLPCLLAIETRSKFIKKTK